MLILNNLPSVATTFVGREKELTDIAALLADPACRLVSIVGAGGIGKTRLALHAATELQSLFPDGITFVPLAPVNSPDLIPAAIAGALNISFFGSEEPRLQLMNYLREKQLLLIMDNFEHLLMGTNLTSDFLQAAPNLKILTTSRERLKLQEEWVFTLDGLDYPQQAATNSLENYSAVGLFVQRARQLDRHFSLAKNAAAVKAICQQVEGMPLGLEMAAAWLHSLSCDQIATQITGNIKHLTSPFRNISERHRSLHEVFEQSWNMLSTDEQSVLMKLSIFHGGFDLEAASYIAGASLSLLAGLVDHSFIRLNNGRYDMHELLRQFASEKLAHLNATQIISQRHFDYFMTLAEQTEQHLFGREQVAWFDRLETELDNLRTALAWSIQTEAGLRLAAALGWFFSERTYWIEGIRWLDQALAANPNATASLRAKSLHNIGALYGQIGDDSGVRTNCNQSIVIARMIRDDWNLAWGLSHLGQYTFRDLHVSVFNLEESIALFRKLDDKMGLTHTLVRLAWKQLRLKDLPRALPSLDEANSLANAVGDVIILGWVAHTHGNIARISCDFKESELHFKTSIDHFQRARFPNGVHFSLLGLAKTLFNIGDIAHSLKLYKEAATLNELSLGSNIRSDTILEGLASIAMKRGQFAQATYLLAAGDEIFVKWSISPPESSPFWDAVPELRAKLGEDVFTQAWKEGAAMTWKQAIDYAFEHLQVSTSTAPTPKTSDSPLNSRETEILRLLSDGLNSTEIADRLFLSVGTIRWYLKEIYSKLDVHSRSEAIARAKSIEILV